MPSLTSSSSLIESARALHITRAPALPRRELIHSYLLSPRKDPILSKLILDNLATDAIENPPTAVAGVNAPSGNDTIDTDSLEAVFNDSLPTPVVLEPSHDAHSCSLSQGCDHTCSASQGCLPTGESSPVIPATPAVNTRKRALTPRSSSHNQLPDPIPVHVAAHVASPIRLKPPYEVPAISEYPECSGLMLGLRSVAELLHQLQSLQDRPINES